MNSTTNPVVAAVADASGEMLALEPHPTPSRETAEIAGEDCMLVKPEPCFSFDEENYTEGDLGEALQQLEDRGDLVEGVVFYMGDVDRRAPSAYFVVRDMLDSMGERAADEAGEWADDFPALTKEKVAELNALISTWLDGNVPATFFTASNTHEVTVTAEMIADHARATGDQQS